MANVFKFSRKIPKSKKWARRRYHKRMRRYEEALQRIAQPLANRIKESLLESGVLRKCFIVEDLP